MSGTRAEGEFKMTTPSTASRGLLLLLVTLMTGPAWGGDFNATVSAGSDYIFRSESQTNHRPALQGSLEYDAADGLYGGVFASNVSWVRDARPPGMDVRNGIEIDAWGGFRHDLGTGFSYDLGVYHYAYPGRYPAHDYALPDTSEAYAQLAWHGLSVRYWYAFSNWFGMAGSAGSGYVDLNETWSFARTWMLSGHLGHQSVAGYRGAASFTDWKLGLGHQFRHAWLLSLAWSRGNGRRTWYSNDQGRLITRGALVATLSKSFGF